MRSKNLGSNPVDCSLQRHRDNIAKTKHANEQTFVAHLLEQEPLSEPQRSAILKSSKTLVAACRKDTRNQTLLDTFLLEFGLSNKEGVALMCLAEALSRVPDETTADRLIAEKILSGNWQSHAGNSNSWLVNSATWGMMLTGKLVKLDDDISEQPKAWLKRLTSKLTEPVVRAAILHAMRIMGSQYVLGQTINEGIAKGLQLNSCKTRYSFDMLGEAARTKSDALRYYRSYSDALDKVGQLNQQNDIRIADSVSVKLSALHPKYHFSHRQIVMEELLPRITRLCVKAKHYNIGLSIDAEEADRLDISLDLFERLCFTPELRDWNGLGFVLQAYQKRAPAVANWLSLLTEKTDRKISVRLVKGAYWDTEIQQAQEQGLEDYPVFTRKANTDLCYLHCANILLSAKKYIFSQFATHNAYTVSAINVLAQSLSNQHFEFQRLHGMGELLYKHLQNAPPIRVYAPIGNHADLLPYLVRRLLENGANSSFVNRFLDDKTPIDDLIQDAYQEAAAHASFRHAQIPLPVDIFRTAGDYRANSAGIDLNDSRAVQKVIDTVESISQKPLSAHSLISGKPKIGITFSVANPSQVNTPAGECSHSTPAMIESALASADSAFKYWSSRPNAEHARLLMQAADLLEKHKFELIAIINTEAGRTLADCVSEVREAVDFCRYYALQISKDRTSPAQGTFLCISPWNFPLAIFVGQVAAALAAGNCVLAKPAEQTPFSAAKAVQLLHQAGIPKDTLHLLNGDGPTIASQLLKDPRISGVAFTGSSNTAQQINQTIAMRTGRTIPLIAETGGQNCMIVDSTALPEQVVDDVISSAFFSAGQRCSALRVLYLHDVIADQVIEMLKGAMDSILVGNPQLLASEVGPVIDQQARTQLLAHIQEISAVSLQQHSVALPAEAASSGTYVAPTMIEIDSISRLKHEVFGPVLHVIRYCMSDLEQVIHEVNSTGYGLTFGVHSRIENFADYLFRRTRAGNTYINRNTIGAVVGVNPFGGQGLSGTGPKAGGPNYLSRFKRYLDRDQIDCQSTTNTTFTQRNACSSSHLTSSSCQKIHQISHSVRTSVEAQLPEYSQSINTMLNAVDPLLTTIEDLPGPTGEHNQLHIEPKGLVAIGIDCKNDCENTWHLVSLILYANNSVVLFADNNNQESHTLIRRIHTQFPSQTKISEGHYSDLIKHSNLAALAVASHNPIKNELRVLLANKSGPITPLIEFDNGITRPENARLYASYFIQERTRTDNLIARGGNTQLLNLTA